MSLSKTNNMLRHCAMGHLICAIIMLPLSATASPLSWDTDELGATPVVGSTSLSSLESGRAYINNDLGSALLRIDSNDIGADNAQSFAWGNTAVQARYAPETATGVIFVTRSIRLDNGDGLIQTTQWKPSYFGSFADSFPVANGYQCTAYNPFAQFAGGGEAQNRGMFTQINLSTLQVAVGMLMQHLRADEGWIALGNTRVNKEEHHSGGFFTRKVTVEVDAYTSPHWLVAVPNTVPSGRSVSVSIPVPGGTTDETVSFCLENDPQSIGAPSKNNPDGALKMTSGVNFVNESPFNNLADSEVHAFHHEESDSGFGSFGLAIIIGAAIGGVLGVASGLPSLIDNTFFFQDPDYDLPNGSVLQGQRSTIRNVSASSVAPTRRSAGISQRATVNIDAVKQAGYAGSSGNVSVDAEHADQPFRQTGDFDPYPTIARRLSNKLGDVGGGFSDQARRVTQTMNGMQAKSAMSVMRQELGSLLDYGSDPYGN